MGYEIYGPIGIIIAEVFYTFPHALLIIVTALSIGDARLYEAAKVLRSKSIRTFFTVTLPSAKYGVISAAFVVFTLVITDFGIPKVIGGNYNVLAVDVYKQVIGQQNFEMGAVVSMVLVFPALIAFAVDRIVQRKQVAILTSRSVVHEPNESKTFDRVMFGYCSAISVLILTILGMCFYASLVTVLALQFNPFTKKLSI
jgi:iron(III) transport system permease protein